MSKKLDELTSDIDDAVRTTEEIQDDPSRSEDSIGDVKESLDKAKTTLEELEDEAEAD